MFKVTKRFTSGLLSCLVTEEVTSVEFKVGFVGKPHRYCPSGYVVEKVEAVLKEAA
jgi:hypothetical protein